MRRMNRRPRILEFKEIHLDLFLESYLERILQRQFWFETRSEKYQIVTLLWIRRQEEWEHLVALLKLRNDMKSPIICSDRPPEWVNPIGRSVRWSIIENMYVFHLWLRDESEIRGHRKRI
jgi:ATP-dependent Lon protease